MASNTGTKFSTNIPIVIQNVVLKSAFPKDDASLNVCHIPDGLRSKLDEFRNAIKGVNAHCIAVSETHFKSYMTSKSLELDGFVLHRNDREIRRYGRVALYVRKSVASRIIAKSASRIGMLEYVFVELCLTTHKILFGVMYKPPKIYDIEVFERVLQDLSPQYPEVILSGDFNEDLIAKSSKTVRFINVARALSLDFVSYEPTHFSSTSSTCIDHFLTNLPSKVTRFSQLSLSGISKQDLIFMSYRCNMAFTSSAPVMKRKIHNVDRNQLISDWLKIGWERFMFKNDVNSLVNQFSKAYAPLN